MTTDIDTIKQSIETLHADKIVCLRAMGVPTGNGFTGTFEGYFDDTALLANAVAEYDKRCPKYVSANINPVVPDLLARSYNKMKRVQRGEGTSDADIDKRDWVVIDLDPNRPSGISSTDAEKKRAEEKCHEAIEFLAALGFNAPVVADSGNGYHLWYKTDLEISKANNEIITRFLKELSSLLSDEHTTIDSQIGNPSRLIKVYGTMARKGDSIPSRPHRVSKIVDIPDEITVNPIDLFLAVSGSPEPKPKPPRLPTQTSHSKLERCMSYIDKINGAVAGQGGDVQTFKAACICVNDFDLDESDAMQVMLAYNEKCVPQWTERELRDKIKSAQKSAKLPAGAKNTQPTATPERPQSRQTENSTVHIGNLTDMGNAERLISGCASKILFTNQRGWYAWAGTHWKPQKSMIKQLYRKHVVQQLHREVEEGIANDVPANELKPLMSWCRRSENTSTMNSSLEMASSDERVNLDQNNLDTNKMLFAIQNGTFDLQNGTFQNHNPKNYITRIGNVVYDKNAECSEWHKFLKDIFLGDEDLIFYVQKAVGYSMTGLTTEQCFFIMHGTGRNGKSVFMNVLSDIFGTYAMETPAETLMHSRGQASSRPTNDIARLAGARFVSANETEQGQMLAESKIKALTGDDKIIARFLHKEFFEFVPEFKIWIRTNHKPRIRGSDDGIWRRIHLIPFLYHVPNGKVDKDLTTKLRAELSGILNWCIDGCLAWQSEGLSKPDAVTKATGSYKDSQDLIGLFLQETCEMNESAGYVCKAKDLYDTYLSWCDDAGERSMAKRNFNFRLEERGFTKFRGVGNALMWRGVRVLEQDDIRLRYA